MNTFLRPSAFSRFFLAATLCFTLLSIRAGGQSAPPLVDKNQPFPLTTDQQELQQLREEGQRVYEQGNFPAALKVFRTGLEKAEARHDELFTGRFLNVIGNVYDDMGKFDAALNAHQQALTLRKRLGNPKDIANSFNNIGSVYYHRGQFSKALENYKQALVLREKLGDPGDIAGSLGNIGAAYSGQGRFDDALDFDQQALAVMEKQNDLQAVAFSLNNIGSVYSSLGQFDTALDFYRRASVLLEKQNDQQAAALNFSNIGVLYSMQKHFGEALASYRQALALLKKFGNAQNIALCLNNTGLAYDGLSQFREALNVHRQAMMLEEKSGSIRDIAISLTNMGIVYEHLHRMDRALDCQQRAFHLFEKIGNTLDKARSLNNIGEVYARGERLPEAAASYRRAMEAFEQVGQQVAEAGDVGIFQETTGNIYAGYADVLLKQRRPAQSLEILERGQAQGLARRVQQGTTLTSLLTASDAKMLRQQETRLSQANAHLQALSSGNLPVQSATRQQVKKDQTAAKERYEAAVHDLALLRARLFARYPRYAHRQGQAISYQQMLRFARRHPTTLYLEYVSLDAPATLLFALRDGRITSYHLPVGGKRLSSLIEDWRESILSQTSEETRLARSVYNALLLPVERKGGLRGVKRIVIVANGPLLDIPFAAMLAGNGKRLIERIPISAAFSLASLTWKEKSSQDPATTLRDLLCVADTQGAGGEKIVSATRGGFGALKFARQEGETVFHLYSNALLLTGKQGSEAVVKKEMGRSRLLHFAVHGSLDTHDGMRSALVMAKEPEDSKEDGFLEAREVAEMRLPAKLAVLSACESGRGQKAGGEGLIGLAWAFRVAGVPAIVASQWSVNDAATGRLMQVFYKALKSGRDKDEALRAAMLSVKKEKAAPFYWAAFQIIGETTPLP